VCDLASGQCQPAPAGGADDGGGGGCAASGTHGETHGGAWAVSLGIAIALANGRRRRTR
jgi:hypothetical protein